MSISGYGLTLAGSVSGSITGVKSVSIGGLTVATDEIATVADTNRVVENLPLRVREAPMVVTIKYVKALYATLRTNLLTLASETWTLTDVESSTHVGTGYLTGASEKTLGTDGHAQFTLTITPATSWAFTAGA
jgi:hypothetical protein